ncbi:hypothetical protein SCARD494_07323 [Seiridium cardinale]
MASTISLNMDSKKDGAVELRKGSIANTPNDVTVPVAESSKSNTPVAGKEKSKATKNAGRKQASPTKSGSKKYMVKSKKGKKVLIIDDKSSSSDDSDTDSSSDESDDSDSDAADIRVKSRTKKTKGKKSTKSGKRQAKRAESDSESGDHDTETVKNPEANSAERGKAQKDMGLIQQQLQLLTRQVQYLTHNQTSTYSLGHLGGMALGNSYIPGNPGVVNTNAMNAAALASINNSLTGDQGRNSARGQADTATITGRGGRPSANGRRNSGGLNDGRSLGDEDKDLGRINKTSRTKGQQVAAKGKHRLDFKRVDQVWDSNIHNFKLQDTAESIHSRYDEYLFHVRRTFDWEGKYKATIIDIKSKQLREALRDVMGNIKGVSLVEDTPKLDPNMLFLYLEDLREHMVNLKDLEPEGKNRKERKNVQKWIDQKRRHLRVLVQYLDKDYSQIKKSLYPLLENGLITFDLCWALWKPNTLAYTTTYGSVDEPRIFKIEVAEKQRSILKGEFFYVEGKVCISNIRLCGFPKLTWRKYFEYDGKQFGYGSMAEVIPDFRGARKISSLGCYPLKYHKNELQVRKDLIERGKKFVGLAGSHYKSHQGIAYYKKKKSVIKVNINGRVMVDSSTHRRNNPNYPISLVRPKDHDLLSDPEDSDEEGCCGSDSDPAGDGGKSLIDDDDRVKYVTKFIKDKDGNASSIRIAKEDLDDSDKDNLNDFSGMDDSDIGDKGGATKDDTVDEETTSSQTEDDKPSSREFAEEEYLIASPVVLGFAFAEKLWLELSVSGVSEISWNESAYDSLVLEPKTKDIVKALVESHKYHAAESIDDVIQGKGRGLVFVLHGPPGTGKTLTAEGISELLKCPLYNVSAGDLGTDSRLLEGELQRVLDICHAWGAILLLDEADVFLEKRNMHDIHRNALVSIFLRQLEYFQGILFLTTNRVETFDDAFQSRIHIALRYDELDTKAKMAIFKIFIQRVRALQEVPITNFTEEDYNSLARHNLNGRQIKNTIRTAQALAVNRGEPLSMKHIVQFLDVLQSFERDLKGGSGYQE